MTRDDFIQTLGRFVGLDIVKAYKSDSPTEYAFELYVNVEEKKRTQIVHVSLIDDDNKVLAYSLIGKCPSDSESLINFLKENIDGFYSRICVLNENLVQLYKYPLEELEYMEMLKAFDEVSRYADHFEKKYFGGADKH